MSKKLDPFEPHWPKGLKAREYYRVLCDDYGRNQLCWLKLIIADDGDVHVSMMQMDRPDSEPHPVPSIRVRTLAGGGRNTRTRQALLWLAQAIRLDNEENGVDND